MKNFWDPVKRCLPGWRTNKTGSTEGKKRHIGHLTLSRGFRTNVSPKKQNNKTNSAPLLRVIKKDRSKGSGLKVAGARRPPLPPQGPGTDECRVWRVAWGDETSRRTGRPAGTIAPWPTGDGRPSSFTVLGPSASFGSYAEEKVEGATASKVDDSSG